MLLGGRFRKRFLTVIGLSTNAARTDLGSLPLLRRSEHIYRGVGDARLGRLAADGVGILDTLASPTDATVSISAATVMLSAICMPSACRPASDSAGLTVAE